MKTYHLMPVLHWKTAKPGHTRCCEKPMRKMPVGDVLVAHWEDVPEGEQICGGPSPEQVKQMNKLQDAAERGLI